MKKEMNDLEQFARTAQNKRELNKWTHYFEVYDRHFNRFRNQEIVVLEIGVDQGGSLQMWKNYFGDKAKIYGIDINPKCKEYEEDNIQIFIGSQSDKRFLEEIKSSIPPIDILIDDGGHTMKQQIITFDMLFEHIKEDGVYLCEDLHTSYWLNYGGGYKRRGTYIEYSKHLIDQLNAWHSRQSFFLKVNDFTRTVNSMHYYDSMLVIEKRKREKPHSETFGTPVIEQSSLNKKRKVFKVFIWKSVKLVNIILRFFGLKNIKDMPWVN